MSNIIDINELSVKTASIEIKTLILSDKQMTLAVFRQLQRRELIDLETLEQIGIPWGFVNYHPRHVCVEPPRGEAHLHIIWQAGREIFHDVICQTPYRHYRSLEYRIPKSLARQDNLNAYLSRWRDIYNQFEKLDQLFIAI